MSQQNQVTKGIVWAACASISWGISGTVLQLISQNLSIPASWMLSTRLSVTGIILLGYSLIRYGKRIFDVFKTRQSTMSVITYAIFGLGLNLLTFYLSIQTGNASMATILQYLSPLFIVLGGIVLRHQWPLRSDIIAFVLALIGVVFCITRGRFDHLDIPLVSLLWGIGSGITAALYVVLPRRAAADNPPEVVLGWGTFIAGIVFNLYHPFWINTPTISPVLTASVATVILFGTILPFTMLLHATRFAPSDVISIMDALQPITTTILSVIFFAAKMNVWEIVGIVIVLLAVYILQRGRRQPISENEDN